MNVFPFDDGVWAKEPHHVLKPMNGETRSPQVRYTWAGPLNPQLYGDKLKQLSSETDYNLRRLERERQRPVSSLYRSLGISVRERSAGSKRSISHDPKVMFASRDSLNSVTSTCMTDDTASTMSLSGPVNFCYLCSSMDEHQQHLQRMRATRKTAKLGKPRIHYEAPRPKVKPKVEEEPKVHYPERYKIVVYTGDVPDGSTNANVTISIKGDEDVLLPTRLYKGNSNRKTFFRNGSKETFFIKAPQLGNLEYLAIEHDGMEKRQGWYLDKVEVTCMRTLRHWVFICKNWVSLHHGDFSLRRTLTAKYKEKIVHEYECTVMTGKKRLAGTDANIFVTFHGTEGFSPKIHLTSDSPKKLFEKGSVDKFHISFKDIGDIRSLRVEHDGKGVASGWLLDRVRHIVQSNLSHDPGFKRIPASKVLGKLFAINLRLVQERHYVSLIPLHTTETGISSSSMGLTARWNFIKIILQNMHQHNVIYYFLLNGWLARDIGDGHLWREILAKKKLAKEVTTGKPVNYQVTVKTGDVKYAGTDANVFIVIHGTKGTTRKLFMDDARDNFERGSTEVFDLTAMNVGPISRIQIGHDNSGPGAGWYCETVSVRKYLHHDDVVRFLKKLKMKAKPKTQKKRLSQKLREQQMLEEDANSDKSDDTSDEEEEIKEGSYQDVFDSDGKVTKLPEYEEYVFECKNWLATDEADGLLERELNVKNKSVFFRDRS